MATSKQTRLVVAGIAITLALVLIYVAVYVTFLSHPATVTTSTSLSAERPVDKTETPEQYAVAIVLEHGYSPLGTSVSPGLDPAITGMEGDVWKSTRQYVVDCDLGGGEHHYANVTVAERVYSDGRRTMQATSGVMDQRYDFINDMMV